MKFKGIYTALITPFNQGEVDFKSLTRLIQKQLSDGVDGFVVNGTTAESPTLKKDEVIKIMEITRHEVCQKIPIIMGMGHNSTAMALENLNLAEKLKADAVLAVVPYYNKPSQEGLKKHFKKIAQNSNRPVVLYNVPSRTVTHLKASTIFDLSKEKNIKGIKEASGDLNFLDQLLSFSYDKDFSFLSGDDSTFLPFIKNGGHGVISVISHFMAKQMQEALNQNSKDFENKYQRLIQLLFKVSNPMMIKQVLFLKGMIQSPELRLPLVEPSSDLVEELKSLLKRGGFLT